MLSKLVSVLCLKPYVEILLFIVYFLVLGGQGVATYSSICPQPLGTQGIH